MDDRRAPYLQVADALRAAILDRVYEPGDQLPAVSELAEQYGVAKMTVQRAVGLLRNEGLVMSWQGRGTFVREPRDADVSREDETGYTAIMDRLNSIHDHLLSLEQRVAALEDSASTSERERRPGA